LNDLENDFAELCITEDKWPQHAKPTTELYSAFYNYIHRVNHNLVCASCGCIDHDVESIRFVASVYPKLSLLQVDRNIVPFDFSCGIPPLDEDNIMIDPEAINPSNGQIALCMSCFKQLEDNCKPAEALANFRWIGPVPPEMQGLSWIEEMLIARAHVVGKVMRFQDRSVNGYASLKGHIVVLPQDTTTLLDKLPLAPASLKDIVFLVWVGGAPKREKLSRYFTVRKQKVLDALHWLCAHHEDYREVAIDETELSSWDSVFVTESLLDSIARISSTSADDAAQTGLATEDVDNDKVEGDLPITTTAILDANSVKDSPDVATWTA
jgi:hypothetical protein